MRKNIVEKVHRIKELIHSKIAVYSSETYVLSKHSQEWTWEADTYSNKRWLTLLSREHYYETSKVFKVADKKELHKILALTKNNYSPIDDAHIQYRIIPMKNGEFTVNFWCIRKELIDELSQQTLFVIPISAIFSQLKSTDLLSFDVPGGSRLNIANQLGVIDSYTDNFNPLEVAYKLELQGERKPVGLDYLIQLIQKFNWLEIRHSLLSRPVSFESLMKPGLYRPAGMILGGAFLFNSLYLLAYDAYLNHQYESLGEEIGVLVQERQLLDSQIKLLSQYDGYLSSGIDGLKMERLLNSVNFNEFKVDLSRLSVQPNEIRMVGLTRDALGLIAHLSQVEGVNNPRFTSSATQDSRSGKEQFSIVFEY